MVIDSGDENGSSDDDDHHHLIVVMVVVAVVVMIREVVMMKVMKLVRCDNDNNDKGSKISMSLKSTLFKTTIHLQKLKK